MSSIIKKGPEFVLCATCEVRSPERNGYCRVCSKKRTELINGLGEDSEAAKRIGVDNSIRLHWKLSEKAQPVLIRSYARAHGISEAEVIELARQKNLKLLGSARQPEEPVYLPVKSVLALDLHLAPND